MPHRYVYSTTPGGRSFLWQVAIESRGLRVSGRSLLVSSCECEPPHPAPGASSHPASVEDRRPTCGRSRDASYLHLFYLYGRPLKSTTRTLIRFDSQLTSYSMRIEPIRILYVSCRPASFFTSYSGVGAGFCVNASKANRALRP